MASKTRIVVTSKLEHLKRADKILLLHNGDCYFYGTFSELQAQRPDFSSLLLGLQAYDNINAERRSSILTETLRRVSVDETAGFRGPEPIRQSFRQPPPPPIIISGPQGHAGGEGYPEKRKQSLILNPLAAARKFSLMGGGGAPAVAEEDEHEHGERRFSVVPEDEQVEEVLPRDNSYHHGLPQLSGQRRQSVLAFITHSQGQERREQIQSSFRRKLSITPQAELASELDIYSRRLSKDSVYDISEDVDEEDMEVRLRSRTACGGLGAVTDLPLLLPVCVAAMLCRRSRDDLREHLVEHLPALRHHQQEPGLRPHLHPHHLRH